MKLNVVSYVDCKSVEKTIEEFKQSMKYTDASSEYKQGVDDLVDQLSALMIKAELKLLCRRG